MNKIILSGDNVIIKAKLKKSSIELPAGSEMPFDDKTKFPKIAFMSKRANEVFPELVIGSKIVTVVDLSKCPMVNGALGIGSPSDDKKVTEVYFLIKIFDIVGIVE